MELSFFILIIFIISHHSISFSTSRLSIHKNCSFFFFELKKDFLFFGEEIYKKIKKTIYAFQGGKSNSFNEFII